MSVVADIQIALDETNATVLPEKKTIEQWVNLAVDDSAYVKDTKHTGESLSITVRFVEPEEISKLNKDYRHKDGPTNVLSFPFARPTGVPEGEAENSLGDIVICVSVVEREAAEQKKTVDAHWAHMLIHGTLHLLGYDHQSEREASEMESLEASILKKLGYSDPYV